MASIPRVIKWGFNPVESKLEALRHQQDRSLWAVLRFGHIVDQHFNDEVAALAANLRARPPVNAHDLFHRAWDFGLHGFGVDPKNAPYKADEQWWGELLEVLRGNLTIEHEWPGKVTAAFHRPAHGGYPAVANGVPPTTKRGASW